MVDPMAIAAQAKAPQHLRPYIRAGDFTEHTAGLCPEYFQANIVILPRAHAKDFLQYCHANSQACPLVAVTQPGRRKLNTLGFDIDICTDVPKYRIFRCNSENPQTETLVEIATNVSGLWTQDMVGFVLGCSFAFDHALQQAGVTIPHIERGRNVSMYKTKKLTKPCGPFQGELVVSMRLLRPQDVPRAVLLSAQFPQAHGAPIAIGPGDSLGIRDVMHPEFGDEPHPDDFHNRVPVFWACGVTPQLAIQNANLPLAITHLPGHMLITDQLGRNIKILSSADSERTSIASHLRRTMIDAHIRGKIETIVLANDPRQIGYLTCGDSAPITSDHICRAAEAIYHARLGTAIVATGFYIPEAESAETDGPPGAAALASALDKLGFHSIVATDERCRAVVTTSVEAAGLPPSRILAFPPHTDDPAAAENYIKSLNAAFAASSQPITLMIAIERVSGSRGPENLPRNCHGVSLKGCCSRIDKWFEEDLLPASCNLTIGIGDGGNEIGFGNVGTSALSEALRPIAAQISTTHLIIGGTSNWASYGLITALSLLRGKGVESFLPSVDEARFQVLRIVEVGAVDGITHKCEATVDGMPLEATVEVLQALGAVITDETGSI